MGKHKRIVRRRICWPNPDATCLNGGCGYCNDSRFRSLNTIERFAKTAGVLPHRGIGDDDAWTAYTWGLSHHFCNAEVEYADL